MDDLLQRDVDRVLQRKTEAEIRHALSTVKPCGRDASIYQAALHGIEAREAQAASSLAEFQHSETIKEARFSRRISYAAFVVSVFAIAWSICGDLSTPESRAPETATPPPHTEFEKSESTSSTEPDAPEAQTPPKPGE